MISAGPRVLNDTSPAIDHVALNDLYFEPSMLDKRQSSVNEMSFALLYSFFIEQICLKFTYFYILND